jgi:hypothetical protein
MKQFEYDIEPRSCCYKGQLLDSLTELRFVLSIEDTHAWLREDLKLYFDSEYTKPGELPPIRSITPDFLIRNWRTGKAHLIEVKPAGYNLLFDQIRRKKIIDSYISYFGYDWTYTLNLDSQVILPVEKLEKYKALIRTSHRFQPSFYGSLLQNESRMSDQEYLAFVRDGLSPASVP